MANDTVRYEAGKHLAVALPVTSSCKILLFEYLETTVNSVTLLTLDNLFGS